METSDRPAIALISQAAYHVDELAPLAAELRHRGFDATLHLAQARPGPMRRLRAAHRRYERSVAQAASWHLGIGEETTGEELTGIAALVVMTDWETTRGTIDRARAEGALIVGRVEGAQDFGDADTGKDRQPYRHVDLVLCQGANDADALADTTHAVVGNSRLQAILDGPANPTRSGPIVVNSNFSYDVLSDAQRPWLDDVLSACQASGSPFVVSRHPADRGSVPRRHLTSVPVEELLRSAPMLITRFSSLGFEALARGVPVIYHNPHGERTAPFDGDVPGIGPALVITSNRPDLESAIRADSAPGIDPATVRSHAAAILERQVDTTSRPPHERAADVIIEHLEQSKGVMAP